MVTRSYRDARTNLKSSFLVATKRLYMRVSVRPSVGPSDGRMDGRSVTSSLFGLLGATNAVYTALFYC